MPSSGGSCLLAVAPSTPSTTAPNHVTAEPADVMRPERPAYGGFAELDKADIMVADMKPDPHILADSLSPDTAGYLTAFKIFRVRRNGTLGSPFINRRAILPSNTWLRADLIPTKGFAVRHGWHALLRPEAPHIKLHLASGENRMWFEVRLFDYELLQRPESQGGTWALAKHLKIIHPLRN